ncbi:MAG: helix-turn-helix transcriptional regulator [Pseudomonadota bacterium]
MTNKLTTAFDKRLGERLRKARLARGLSQEELARRLNISRQQLQKYEIGENRLSSERLYMTSRELDMSLAYFLGVEDVDIRAQDLSDATLRLAGQIQALPDLQIRHGVSSLVNSISRAWDKR